MRRLRYIGQAYIWRARFFKRRLVHRVLRRERDL